MKQNIVFQDVQAAFEQAVSRAVEAIDDFPWEDEACYAHWLGQTYYLVRHTTRFLTSTAGRIEIEDEETHKFLLHHLKEEAGHEMLAYNDLVKLGWKIDMVPETIEATLMLQSQYYWISKTPYAHFSFFWVLEQLSVLRGKKIIDRVLTVHSPKTVSFLKLHAAEDVQHIKDIYNQITRHEPEEYAAIYHNLNQTGYLYSLMLKNIKAQHYRKERAA